MSLHDRLQRRLRRASGAIAQGDASGAVLENALEVGLFGFGVLVLCFFSRFGCGSKPKVPFLWGLPL